MKQLITFLFALVATSAFAQYPLPDTRVYGSLTVDSSFVNDRAGVILVNDSVRLAPGFAERGAAIYDLNSPDFNLLGYFPDGFFDGKPQAYIRLEAGDTVSALQIYAIPNAIGQLVKLESRYGAGNNGFETQIDAGLNTTKIYATNASGSTNLSVIEVDSVSIRIKTDNSATITEYNSNGVVIPSLSSEPTGQNGAMYYNTSTNTLRVYENGAWRNM